MNYGIQFNPISIEFNLFIPDKISLGLYIQTTLYLEKIFKKN